MNNRPLSEQQERHGHTAQRAVAGDDDSDADAIEQALAQGATAYLTKPVSIERLLALLRQVGTSASASPPANPPVPAGATAHAAESSLSVICRIATTEQRHTYLQSWQTELKQDSAELLAALHAHDRAAAMARLRRLQNAFLVMGRGEAVALCTQLREAIRTERSLEPALGSLQAELHATAMMLCERLAGTVPVKADTASIHPA